MKKRTALILTATLLVGGLACGKTQPQNSATNQSQSEVKLAKINVSGMTCAGCTSRIEAMIKKLPGVKSCKASVPDKNVQVSYDAAQVQLAGIEKTIESQGYKVVK